jgi:hypothetical protein
MERGSSYTRQRAPSVQDISMTRSNFLRTRLKDGGGASPPSACAKDTSANRTRSAVRSDIKKQATSGCKTSTSLANSWTPVPSRPTNTTYSPEDAFFHLLINNRASSDEILFIMTAETFGLGQAIYLGKQFGWNYQRPLHALRALIDGLALHQTNQEPRTPRAQRRI